MSRNTYSCTKVVRGSTGYMGRSPCFPKWLWGGKAIPGLRWMSGFHIWLQEHGHEAYVFLTRRTYWVVIEGNLQPYQLRSQLTKRTRGTPQECMLLFREAKGTAVILNAYDETICAKYLQPDGSFVRMASAVDIGRGCGFMDAVDRLAEK